uniref:Uncharacterized protein n=1 Tax=Sphaerodactylus townsendi TaxID=933632 RepID=A0ACB8EZK3_9SAUR
MGYQYIRHMAVFENYRSFSQLKLIAVSLAQSTKLYIDTNVVWQVALPSYSLVRCISQTRTKRPFGFPERPYAVASPAVKSLYSQYTWNSTKNNSFFKEIILRKSHQKRFVRVVCEGLLDSWTSRLPGTDVKTEVTDGILGLVKSVKVVGVLEGLMEALEISEAGPDGVPAWSVESDVLSTPVFS